MNKLKDHNENLKPPLYLPSHIENLEEKHEYFEVPDLETKIQRHDNPHYWLQRDILQLKQFQYRFFQNINLKEDTFAQFFFQFLLYFLRFNYQVLWEQQVQDAYTSFHQVLREVGLLPFIIHNRNRHSHYRDHTSFRTQCLEQINIIDDFIIENSETSDNRPYTTFNITSKTSFEEYDQDISQLIPDNKTHILQNQ